jgi:hypothetical protein
MAVAAGWLVVETIYHQVVEREKAGRSLWD